MITKATVDRYNLSCDRCGTPLFDPCDPEAWAAYVEDAEIAAGEDGWEEIDGRLLCDDCKNYPNKNYLEED